MTYRCAGAGMVLLGWLVLAGCAGMSGGKAAPGVAVIQPLSGPLPERSAVRVARMQLAGAPADRSEELWRLSLGRRFQATLVETLDGSEGLPLLIVGAGEIPTFREHLEGRRAERSPYETQFGTAAGEEAGDGLDLEAFVAAGVWESSDYEVRSLLQGHSYQPAAAVDPLTGLVEKTIAEQVTVEMDLVELARDRVVFRLYVTGRGDDVLRQVARSFARELERQIRGDALPRRAPRGSGPGL